MEKIKTFIQEYQEIILNKEKSPKKPVQLYLYGILGVLFLGGLVFLFGNLFNVLHQLNYLVVMTSFGVFLSYVFYKNLTARHYMKQTGSSISIFKYNAMHYLYAFSIIMTSTALLSVTVFSKAMSILLIILYILLALSSVMLYFFVEKEKTKIKMPGAWNTVINGFFIAILFYTVTLLVQVNNIPLSFVIVVPVMLVLIIVKRYIEKKYIIRMKRAAIVSLGFFLIILSFPFTTSFNYISFYRGEFSFRILYEQFDNPVKEFESGVNGDVIFFEDDIIVVNDNITFYNDDLVEKQSIVNNYDYIYLMNGSLRANKTDISTPGFTEVYNFNGTNFTLLGTYYGDSTDTIYLDSNGVQYVPVNGYVYSDELGGLQRITNQDLEDYTEITKGEDFITFKYSRVIFASSDSFYNDVDGYHYDNIAYHNDHMAFVYNTVFVTKYSKKVDPRDDGETILYLVDENEYMENNAAYQNSIKMPKLFRLNNFYYFDGHYYLLGHIEYVNGDKFGKVYVYNDDGDLEFESIFEADNAAINEKYIAYGTDTIKLYDIDSKTSMTYHLITGYGLLWGTISLVALLAIKEIHLNPRRDLDYKIEEKAE